MRCSLDIVLDNHAEDKVYTTYDSITGNVNITASQDSPFDDIRITLEGSTKTYVENFAPHSSKNKTLAYHNFLRLNMPIRESSYPVPRIAEAGRTYKFPFNFAIPEKLLPRACSHHCSTEYVHEAHLQLPPSLGDREVSVYDDLAPDMSKITYMIHVKVIKNKDRDGSNVVLVAGMKKLRVFPAVSEAPPMTIGDGYDEYVLSKAKMLRKGVFSGKLGRITASVAQPSAIMLPLATVDSLVPIPATTMATINLRFDPQTEVCKPPRLGGLRTKIRASTFYSVRPACVFPTVKGAIVDFTSGVYEFNATVSSRCVEAVVWEKQISPAGAPRRYSDSSDTSTDDSDNTTTTDHRNINTYYTATILVPINLPSCKRFVPTFHSCIVSRAYTLDMSLTIHTPGTVVPASSVSLHVPVQIAAMGNLPGFVELTPAEAAAELAQANEFFRPRIIERPDEEFIGRSTLNFDLPPSYDFCSTPRAVEPSRS